MFNRAGRGPVDFTQNFINIDTLCDIVVSTQKEAGVPPIFEVKDEFKTLSSEEKKEELKKEYKLPDGIPEEYLELAPLFGVDLGTDEDEEEFFLCDLCTALGSRQKYDAAICDACSSCESCVQYEDECSGCSYSVYRDGMYYRDKVSEKELLSADDLVKFDQIKNPCSMRERFQRHHFSVKH